jgi:hypothetical protein
MSHQILDDFIAFLDRRKLEYERSEEQYCVRLDVKERRNKIPVKIFNNGTIQIQGSECDLKKLLSEARKALEGGSSYNGQLLPFEIDNLPKTIADTVPQCDSVVIEFVKEAICCLNGDSLLGCAFMLGAASERAIGMLIRSYCDAITDEESKKKFQSRLNKRTISSWYEDFKESYRGCQNRPPSDSPITQDLDTLIEQTFQFCRMTRNEVGHPQVVPNLTRGAQIANLGYFSEYIKRIYLLIEHFKANGVQISKKASI